MALTGGAAVSQVAGEVITNPGFSGPSCIEGWEYATIDAPVVCSLGNGVVWLNHNNRTGDPTVQQTVTGLTPGTTYRISATWKAGPTAMTYANGQTTIFGISVDGNVTSFDADTLSGDHFQTSVMDYTATSNQATIAFLGELGGVDGDVALDGVSMVAAGSGDVAIEDEDWLTADTVTTENAAPQVTSGPVSLGIRWNTPGCADVDVDLYVRENADQQYLYYNNIEAPFGEYGEDIVSNSGTSVEEAILHNTSDVRTLDIVLNHYSGSCSGGVTGVVRAQFNDAIYEMPFTLSGAPDQGQSVPNPSGSPSSVVIPAAQLFNY